MGRDQRLVRTRYVCELKIAGTKEGDSKSPSFYLARMDTKDLLGSILKIGINLLIKALPFIGSLIGGPLGWIAGFIVSELAGSLIKLVDEAIRLGVVDKAVRAEVETLAKASSDYFALVDKIQKGETVTEEEKAAARKALKDATKNLIHFDIKPKP